MKDSHYPKDDFEDFKAELEATEATITRELFDYWSTNTNLEIQFDIDKIEDTHPQRGTRIVEHVLDIRVRNNRTKMSLPLRHRSKGFNWFFSFLVWFKKIQEDKGSNYILLLDEPGLNLHASAQILAETIKAELSANFIKCSDCQNPMYETIVDRWYHNESRASDSDGEFPRYVDGYKCSELIKLPKRERLEIVRFLLFLDNRSLDSDDIDSAWEKEITDRVRAVDEGTAIGIVMIRQ